MNFLQRTQPLLLKLRQRSIRTFTFVVQRNKDLTIRLAESTDFDKVSKLSEGLYGAHDYLPVIFHQWITLDNLAVMLALDGEKAIGLLACSVVDDGKTIVRRGGRVLPECRGQGVFRELSHGLDEYVRSHFLHVCRERQSTYTSQIPISKDSPWRRVSEYDALYYDVQEKTSRANEHKLSLEDRLEIESCTNEYFSNVILSHPLSEQLFRNNLLVIDRVPFQPLRSNIDLILREHDLHLFVEKCSADAWPRSFSHGVHAQRVNAVEWLATVHTDDPALFEAHLLHQFQRGCEVTQGKQFIFFTFQDKSMTAFTKRVLGDMLHLKEFKFITSEPLGIFERVFKRHNSE